MLNKRKRPELDLEEALTTFNTFVVNRDYRCAWDYLKRQPERVKRAIIYDKDGWYKTLRVSCV